MSVNVVGFLDLPASNLIDADSSIFFASSESIWRTEGAETSISLVLSASGLEESANLNFYLDDAVGSNGQLLFSAADNEFELEPWISDGTPQGTRVLKDINLNGSSNPQNFFNLGGTFYFTVEDGVSPRALWKSDGTPEGTVSVANIAPESSFEDFLSSRGNIDYQEFTNFNETLFFYGFWSATSISQNGLLTSNSQNGLWKSDGTTEGTVFVRDFGSSGELSDFTVVNDTLFFISRNELWKSDGTTEGTQLVSQVSIPKELTSVGDTLFFVQRNGDFGEELWKSDGTTEGTTLVRDIRIPERVSGVARNFGSEPENLIDVNGTLFFTADDNQNGRSLWKSDGTEEGTQLVDNPNGFLSHFTKVDETLYFTSNSQALWQSDGTEEGTFAIEPEELFIDSNRVRDSFQLRRGGIELLEFNDQLYFTGEAYSIEEGNYQSALLTLADIDNTTVYRLFDPNAGVHFYTTDTSERDEFIATGNYQSEGASYRSVEPSAEGAEDVFRFFNETTGVHLYTTNEVERDVIIDTLPDFTFQGVRFSAYETQVEGSIPIYRFYEPSIGVHLYTPSEVERDAVQADLPNYNFEGIAYYALPLETAEL